MLLRPTEASSWVTAASLLKLQSRAPTADAVGRLLTGLWYIPDPETCDLWRSPADTIAIGGGDCEDLSLLGASVLIGLGCRSDVVIGDLWANNAWKRHAWIEGEDERSPFLLEATSGLVARWTRPSGYRPCARFGTLTRATRAA